jgi:hypothetical protein
MPRIGVQWVVLEAPRRADTESIVDVGTGLYFVHSTQCWGWEKCIQVVLQVTSVSWSADFKHACKLTFS